MAKFSHSFLAAILPAFMHDRVYLYSGTIPECDPVTGFEISPGTLLATVGCRLIGTEELGTIDIRVPLNADTPDLEGYNLPVPIGVVVTSGTVGYIKYGLSPEQYLAQSFGFTSVGVVGYGPDDIASCDLRMYFTVGEAPGEGVDVVMENIHLVAGDRVGVLPGFIAVRGG